MSIDLTGIKNCNEYYTNHYFSSIFEANTADTLKRWREAAKEDELRTPWSLLKEAGRQYYRLHDRYGHVRNEHQSEPLIKELAGYFLNALGYIGTSSRITVTDGIVAPVFLEKNKQNGAPLLWVLLSRTQEHDGELMDGLCFDGNEGTTDEDLIESTQYDLLISNEELLSKIYFSMDEAPRWVLIFGMNQIILADRTKWNEKRYLSFQLDDIFSRREDSTLQAMSVLLHEESLCPTEGTSLLDQLDENSHKHSAGVSQDLKYAIRECIERLGNEVLFDISNRQKGKLPDESQLTIECLRYMYRFLFVLFIEARPELGYAPMKSEVYLKGYSLEGLRDIAETAQDDLDSVGEGYYLHETIAKLFRIIYEGYPNDFDIGTSQEMDSMHDVFSFVPLKAHIFDPIYTPNLSKAKIRNSVMLKIIDLMSISRPKNGKERRGRISYSALGINQMGAVYEALLSYRGFYADEKLFEVKRACDKFDELDVGYFVPERELDNYTEDERVRYDSEPDKGKLRTYEKGTFIYRLAGREREKSASYYTPEVLTKCLVKYALKELLVGKTADEILRLTVCEPAMGSAAFLNEAINQLAEAYLDKKQKELGEEIPHENRFKELQRVKMYIADRNVYGIDLNPIAVELAEVSLWLNTIYEGAYVPWFGDQLVCGNSLIGARRQVYTIKQITTTSKTGIWHANAPERVTLQEQRNVKKQVYHFLLGDPGMSNYNDKIIKELVPENINAIKKWNKEFIEPLSKEDAETLLRLSSIIDDLWEKQVELRRLVEKRTVDRLSVYGKEDDGEYEPTSIRQKDAIYRELYKSEEQQNAGPYARLKLAMDYWCSLWFWPIDHTEMLPTRQEYLWEMSLILEGGIMSVQPDRQHSIFESDQEQEFTSKFGGIGVVNLDRLCEETPRLRLVMNIVKKQCFLHWELEFADLFSCKGGFDLIIGNPPWIKMMWNEQAVLSDKQPLFAVKDFSASQTANKRTIALHDISTKNLYLSEYEGMSSTLCFLNSIQNYSDLKGQQTNLYKCFLPQAWQFGNSSNISAFIHPDSVYDDPNGGNLREKLYPKIRRHYQFTNELKLFSEVHHNTGFSLNVYCNIPSDSFDTIANLFEVSTIEQCYDETIQGPVPGIKDESNNWNSNGHPDRVILVGKTELELFASLFDNSDNWLQARLPVLHATQLVDALKCFSSQKRTLGSNVEAVYISEMWHETNAQKDGSILRNVHFPETTLDLIYSGPHIGVSNPLFKASRKICNLNSDYDNIDLTKISESYLQRCNYSPSCDASEYTRRISNTPWDEKYHNEYRLIARKMLNLSGERTLIGGLIPPGATHTNGLIGFAFANKFYLGISAALFSSLPYDFFIKVMGKSNLYEDNAGKMPIVESKFTASLCARSLLLNCLTRNYSELWHNQFNDTYLLEQWSKSDLRLNPERYLSISPKWTWDTPLRTEYERRQALVEIDVLTAMSLGMTLVQLQSIYRIQFPVLQSYEADTWYDLNGRIVFTNNRGLIGVGYSRSEWDLYKNYKSGVISRKIIDDTMPGGSVERTIEYFAPFDRCNRVQDYETAWTFFEKRFGNL